MDNYLTYAKTGVAVIGGTLIGLLGGWDMALRVLIYFVVADYITGITAAWYEKKLNSDVGMRGIAKKVLLFVPVGIGYCLDSLTGTEVIRSLAIFFYIGNEGLSILENLTKMGIKFPAVIKDALEQIEKKQEGNGDA